jgi:hypothetical protein
MRYVLRTETVIAKFLIFCLAATAACSDPAGPDQPEPDVTEPTVRIVSPNLNDVLSGTVVLKAIVENATGVAGVRFLANGAAIGSEDTEAPYEVDWLTGEWANGKQALVAVARDRQGNEAQSKVVPVNLFNTGTLRIGIDVTGAGESPETIDVTIGGLTYGTVPVRSQGSGRKGGVLEVSDIPIGAHTVSLAGLPFQCSFPGAAQAQVQADALAEIAFSVGCLEAGTARITVVTEGDSADPDVIGIVVDGTERGRVPGADGGTIDVPLTVGSHSVEIDLLAFHCSAPGGARTIDVTAGGIALLDVPVRCVRMSLAFDAGDWFGTSDIFVASADGGTVVNLTNSAADYESDPSWSPDGTRIAYTVGGYPMGDLWVMQADGSDVTPLVVDGRWNLRARWSPDGSRILYTSDELPATSTNGRHRLVVMNLDGSGRTQITFGTEAYQDLPSGWSPDGSRILFERRHEDGRSELFLVNSDGSGLTTISGTDGAWRPAWSPDGTRIAFGLGWNSCCEGDIAVINADGTGWTNITTGASPVYEGSPVWSTDLWLVFISGGQISVMQADGSDRRVLLPDVYDVWSVDVAP